MDTRKLVHMAVGDIVYCEAAITRFLSIMMCFGSHVLKHITVCESPPGTTAARLVSPPWRDPSSTKQIWWQGMPVSHQPTASLLTLLANKHKMSARWTEQMRKLGSSTTHTDNTGHFPLYPSYSTHSTSLLNMDTHRLCGCLITTERDFGSVYMMEINICGQVLHKKNIYFKWN